METPSPARWAAMQPALDQLLDLELEQRAAFLVAVGSTDPALRQDLEQVLRASERAEGGARSVGGSVRCATPVQGRPISGTDGGAAARPLCDRAPARPGRDGDGLPRPGLRHDRARGPQGAPTGAVGDARRGAVRARDGDRCPPQPSQHSAALRLRLLRGRERGSGSLLLHALRGRPVPPRSSPGELAAAGRHRGRDRTPSGGGAGSRPPAWHRAPGHQAGKRAPLRRARVRGRLRDRARPRRRGRTGSPTPDSPWAPRHT